MEEIDLNFEFNKDNIQESKAQEKNYHKIAGGSYQVINALANKIGFENITTNAIVQQIEDKETFIRITTSEGNFYDAKNVIITIPPRLLEASITFLPKLYEKANEIRKRIPNISTE